MLFGAHLLYKAIAIQAGSSNSRILDYFLYSGAHDDRITSTSECLKRPLLSTVHPASPLLLITQDDVEIAESPLHILTETLDFFEKYIRIILQHSTANRGFFKSSERIWLLLLKNVFNSSAEPPRCSENSTFLSRTWQRRRFREGSNYNVTKKKKEKQPDDLNYHWKKREKIYGKWPSP